VLDEGGRPRENAAATRQAADTPKGPKLARLKIESFRGVEPCELRFSDGFNVLLGLNATGKTTLLELVAAAVSFDFSKFKNEPFAVEYDLVFSTGSIQASVRNERVEQSDLPEAFAAHSFSGGAGVYAPSAHLLVRLDEPSEEWSVQADRSSVWSDKLNRERPLPALLLEGGSNLLLRVFQLISHQELIAAYLDDLRSCATARRFDEALDVFREITSASTWIEASMSRPDGLAAMFKSAGLIPGDLLAAMSARESDISAANQGVTIPSEALSFLHEASELFGFNAARLEMRLEGKTDDQTRTHLRFGDFRFMFEDPDGSVVRHEDLSYGQKRLLAFYYYLAASPTTVIADELVDGLHHLWISKSIDAVGDRRAFLASQNPLLLDHLELDSAEHVASTFIVCRAERSEGKKRMFWSNMSAYDSDRFFRAYKVDVEHVSEILISKGLW